MSPAPAWDPNYPTPGALAYRDGFILGAEMNCLREIPETILSWAIDRAIQNRITSQKAGHVFADVYYRIQMRREPRGGYGSPTAYLLAVYEKELKR